jgi:hypothetical protein
MKKKEKIGKLKKKFEKKKKKEKGKKKHYNPKYFMCRRTMIPLYHLEYVVMYNNYCKVLIFLSFPVAFMETKQQRLSSETNYHLPDQIRPLIKHRVTISVPQDLKLVSKQSNIRNF